MLTVRSGAVADYGAHRDLAGRDSHTIGHGVAARPGTDRHTLSAVTTVLAALLGEYTPRGTTEGRDLERLLELAASPDPWDRRTPVHATGSAVIVHPPTGRVLLRWHDRMRGWLQVGGHGDPGETDPLAVAQREAREETGLPDLRPWPHPDRPQPIHVAIVPVPAGKGEPDHEHADIRYVLATNRPDEIAPEHPGAQLRWLAIDDAAAAVGEDNLRETLRRLAAHRSADGRSLVT